MEPEFIFAAVVVSLLVLVPVVAILTKHQRKMAEIVHKNATPDEETRARIARLEHEVQELRARQADMIVRLDDTTEVQRRIES